jgi:hypothetical protein
MPGDDQQVVPLLRRPGQEPVSGQARMSAAQRDQAAYEREQGVLGLHPIPVEPGQRIVVTLGNPCGNNGRAGTRSLSWNID